MATKGTRKHPAKTMKLKDLAGNGRTEVRAGGAGSGKIKFNE